MCEIPFEIEKGYLSHFQKKVEKKLFTYVLLFPKFPSKIVDASMNRISLILCLLFLVFSQNIFAQQVFGVSFG